MNTKEQHEYAWNWFTYHAAQRLTAFRFFLIFLGFLVVGFATGQKDGNLLIAKTIGWFGAFISFAFLLLEIRNEQLVNVARDALRYLEVTDESLKAHPKLQMLHADRNRSWWLSYKFWLRAIYIVCLVLFVAGAVSAKAICTKI